MTGSKSRKLRNKRRYSGQFRCVCRESWTSHDLMIQESEICTSCGRDVCPTSVNITTEVDTNDNLTAVKSEKYFGQYQCYKCLRTWFSAHAWLGITQQCRDCQVWTDPHRLRHRRKPQGMNKKNDPKRPHEYSMCAKCISLGHNCSKIKNIENSFKNLSIY